LDELATRLNEGARRSRLTINDRLAETKAAIERGHETIDRSRSLLHRSEATLAEGGRRSEREQADVDREIARSDREAGRR